MGLSTFRDSSGSPVDPVSLDFAQTLQELISRLDTLAACKHHLTEALRVQLVGSVGLVTSGSTSVDATSHFYASPAYAKFLHQVALGNLTAEVANIQNVTA